MNERSLAVAALGFLGCTHAGAVLGAFLYNILAQEPALPVPQAEAKVSESMEP